MRHQINQFAPIFIPTLCRYDHLKRCIESLSKCTHADKTDLIIALDYPLKDVHWEGYKKIERYLDTIVGFRSVVVIKRNQNYGVVKNGLETQKEIFEKYDRLIFSEDDNEFSPNFLDYINKGLDRFENDKSVYAICGYNYPIKMPAAYEPNFYYSKAFSAWGYGIWKDRNQDLYYTPRDLVSFIKNWTYLRATYNMAGQKPLSILNSIRSNLPLYGDGVVSINNIKYNTYCIFPAVPKVRNHGHDGSGAHCGDMCKDAFAKQNIDSHREFWFSDDAPLYDSGVAKAIKKYFAISFVQKVATIVKYFLLLIDNKSNKM